MALVVYWYDGVCFAMVGIAVVGSLYVLWKKEGALARSEGMSLYESILIPGPQSDRDANSIDEVPLKSSHDSSSSPQLWTSCWRSLHPAWLLATRLVSLVVLAGFLSWDLHQWGSSIFIYYTEWTYSLVMMYFAIGSVVSARGCWLCYTKEARSTSVERSEVGSDLEKSKLIRKEAIKFQSHYYQEQALQRNGFWGYLMQTAYQTCAGAVILTDVVFWCIIVPFLSNTHLGLNLLMGCMHTVNVVFLLLDTSINRLSFPWFRLAYFVLWSSVYVIFQWLIHLCGFTWWPYPFLELSTPWAPLWYLALAVSHFACYGLYALVVRMKDSLLSELFPHSYVRSL